MSCRSPLVVSLILLLLITAACSTGASGGSAAPAGEADPLAFGDSDTEADPTDTTEMPSEAADTVDPVIVEGLAQAVVADQSGQTKGVVITIEQARCLSARTVLALGVERLAALSLTEGGLADGGFGQAIAALTPSERVELVDATLECVPVETLIGSTAGLTDRETACLADQLEGSEILRVLAIDQLSGNSGTALDGDARSEFLHAIRACVDLAAIMFDGTDIGVDSIACVGDAVRTDPLLDEVFAAVIDGGAVDGSAAAALQAIVDGCLEPEELAALSG